MSSPFGPSCPYTLPRASTMATRNLIASNDNPTSPPSSPHTGNHYERAAAAAVKSDTLPSTTASRAAAVVDHNGCSGGGLHKQQSWKLRDLRAAKQGQVVDAKDGGKRMGYACTGACCGK